MHLSIPRSLRCAVVLTWLFAPFFDPHAAPAQVATTADTTAVEAARQWIAEHAIPLASVEAESGLQDLGPLREALADVRIVGMGEATHGTREIFQFKHRLLEFLVKEMGFTLFAIEASFPAALNVNRYVLYGEGDPAAALASMGFWTWDTEEVSAMIEWMREYNQTVPEARKVRFLGFDLQYIDGSLDAVEDYIGRLTPDYLETAGASLAHVRIDPFEIAGLSQADPAAKRAIAGGLEAVLGFLVLHEESLVQQSSRAEFDMVLQHARIAAQFYDAYSKPVFDPDNPAATGAALRDVYMARNAEWILETAYPGAKVALWAHNGHVSRDVYGGAIPAMGYYLKRRYGEAYYALGFDFDQGSFQARHLDPELPDSAYGVLQEFTVGPAPEGSAAWAFASAGVGDFFLDLRNVPARGEVRTFFSTPMPMASIGAGFSEAAATQQWRAVLAPLDHFDGLVFLGSTTRARPNPTGMRGPIPRSAAGGEEAQQ